MTQNLILGKGNASETLPFTCPIVRGGRELGVGRAARTLWHPWSVPLDRLSSEREGKDCLVHGRILGPHMVSGSQEEVDK